jgi:hypothetical protein
MVAPEPCQAIDGADLAQRTLWRLGTLEKPRSFAMSLLAWSAAMKHTLTLAMLTGLLVVSVTQPSLAEGRTNDRDKRSGCGRAETCGGNLSRADRENLSRAMSRNVLHSIEDRLRRQRYN